MTEWQTQAACLGAPTEVFFPPKGADRNAYKEAQRYCQRCPVVEACAAEALLTDRLFGAHGVWAGMPADERARLVRR